METLMELLKAAVPKVAGITAFVSLLVLIHSGMRLTDTLLGRRMGLKGQIAHAVFPFLILSRRVQPPEKWRYIDRFIYSAALVVVSMVALVFYERLSVIPVP